MCFNADLVYESLNYDPCICVILLHIFSKTNTFILEWKTSIQEMTEQPEYMYFIVIKSIHHNLKFELTHISQFGEKLL